jgi:PAS domain S-box-containing protein
MSNSESNKRPLGWTKTAQKRRRKPEYAKVDVAGVKSIEGSESVQEAKSQRESEEKFRNFLDNLGDVAYEADASGNVTYANKMAEKITGIPLKGIIGKPFLPLFTKESQRIVVDVYERTLNGESAEYELTFTNGKVCHFKNEPLRDENGEITGVFGIARDITERKRVERALQESQKQFKNLFNNALLGLYKTTPDGRILMANPAIVRMLGYDSFEELAKRNLEEVGFEPQYSRSDFKKRIETDGRVVGLEADWVRRDGTILSVRESARAIRDDLGNVLYYEGTVEDITECKRAEQELRRHRDHLEEMVALRTRELERNNEALRIAELRFRSLIEQTTDAVFCYEYDPPIPTDLPLEQQVRSLYDGVLVECNDVCAKSYGAERADGVIGKRLTELFGTTPGSLDKLFTEMIKGGYRIVDGEGIERLEDGTERYYLNNAHGVIEGSGLVRIWGTFRDITDRKKAQKTLRQYKFMVESAHDAIFFKDRQSRYIIANKKTLESFGLPREKVIGRNDYEIMPDEEQAKNNIDDDRTVFETGEPKEIIKEMTGADGKQYWFQAVKVPHFDENGDVAGLIGIARDITERKQAEEELMIREQKLRALLNAPTESAILIDVDGTILDINRIAAQRLGKSSEELIGMGIYDYLPAEIAEYRKARGKEVFSSGKPLRFQDEREGRYYDNNIYPVFDDNGKVNAVAVFSQDITEQKQADRQIRERAKIIDSTTDSVIKTNRDGIVTMWNRGAERIFGYTAEEMIGQPIDTLYPEQERCRLAEIIETLLRGEEISTTEVTCLHKNGSQVELALSVLPLKDDIGNVIDFVGISKDITDRKKAREALQESENRYRTVIENAGEGIVVAQDGMLRFVNSQHTSVTGRSQEESMSRPFVEFVHPDDRQRVAEAHTERLRGGQVPSVSEFRIIDKSGRIRWLENNGVLIEWNGKPASLNFLRDITARKKAEEALREHEEMIRALVETSCDWIWSIDLNSVHTYCNPAVKQILGYSPDELVGKRSLDLLHDDDRIKVEANLPIWIDEKRGWSNLMLRWKHKDGTYRYLESNAVPILSSENELIGFRGADRDITDRKRAEDILTETTGLLETIFGHTHILIAYLDSQFNFVRVNRAYAQTDGREPTFFVGRNHFELYPNSENEAIFREVVESGVPYFAEAKPFEYTEHPEHGITYWDWSLVPIKEQDGVVSGLVLTLADATERKQAEEALRESEEKFRSLAEQSPNMIFINKRGRIVYVNNKCEEVIGYKREELCSENFDFRSLIAPESLDLIKEKFAQHLRGQEVQPYDYSIIKKNGERIEAINASKLIQYEGQTAILGIVTDITGRKRAEQALRESEERLKILFESAPDAIYLADSEGRFVDGNRAAENLIGYAREDIIGKKVADVDLLSAEQLSRAQTNLKKVITGELSGPNEYTVKRRDGTYVSIEVRNFPVKIGGKILSLGIARDITEHKRTEQELLEHQAKLKSLASQLSLTEERERHRLATDLHDQISQSLVISKIKLDQLRRSSGSDELDEPLDDISNCLGRVIDDTRALTFDLSYPILYELGFEAAVCEWLIEQIQEKHRIKTEFKDDGLVKPLDDDICVLLFRNVRELLINVVKHAQASKVRVSIRKVNDNVQVSVEDDGIGFDPHEVTKKATKRAEFGLFSIRERLEQLGGIIVIESEPGSGSKITMKAPLKYDNSTDRMSK